MPFFPQHGADFAYATYPAGPTATGVTVTTGGAHTHGTPAELTSATAFDCTHVRLFVQFTTTTTGRVYMVTLYTGGSGSETPVASNLLFDGSGGSAIGGGGIVDVPLAIPAGTRLSVSAQSGAVGATLTAAVTISRVGTVPGISSFTTYGADTGTTRGVSIDPGATANTKGGWTEITSASSSIIQALVLSCGFGGNGAPDSARWYFDIGTGAPLSETVLIPDIQIEAYGASTVYGLLVRSALVFPYIATGTRIAVRASCSINNATDRKLDVVLLGAPSPSESGGSPGVAGVQLANGGLVQ